MTKVGALLSAYYCEKYLESRVENLLAQSPRPEILAVCLRGSAEHTLLAKYHPDVKLISTMTVPTIYCAWNKAIDWTDCDYLVVANSDDLFYIGALERMQRILDENPDVALVYPNVDISEEYGGDPVGRFELLEFDPETMLTQCYMGPMPMWRRSLHDKYGPFDAQMLVAGDYEFWLRTALSGEKFLHLNVAVGSYLARPDSREQREPIRTLWETARAKSRYRKEPYGPNITNSQTEPDASHSPVSLPRTQLATPCD